MEIFKIEIKDDLFNKILNNFLHEIEITSKFDAAITKWFRNIGFTNTEKRYSKK